MAKLGLSKKYLPDAVKTISEIGEMAESYRRKVVQMHHLVANMAAKFSYTVQTANQQEPLGKLFNYTDIFLGKMNDEFVTVEEFIAGSLSNI